MKNVVSLLLSLCVLAVMSPRSGFAENHRGYNPNNNSNLKVFKVVNTQTNTLDTIQQWDQVVYITEGRRQYRAIETRQQVIKREPLAAPTPAAQPVVAAVEETPTPKTAENPRAHVLEPRMPDAAPKDSGEIERLRPVLPERHIKKDKIPGTIGAPVSDAPATGAKRIRPRAVLANAPELQSVTRYKNVDIGSELKVAEIVDTLKRSSELLAGWTSDIHGRWDLCPVDKFNAKKDGEWEVIYVPFEAVLGRVWILKAELESLRYEMEVEQVESAVWAPKFHRLVRRFEALESQAELLFREEKQDLYAALPKMLSELQSHNEFSGAFDSEAESTWILRWDTVLIDSAIWLENAEFIANRVDDAAAKKIRALQNSMKKFVSRAGDAPWSKTIEVQIQLIGQINKVAEQGSELYEKLAEVNAGTSNPTEYLKLLSLFGANENLRVYSATSLYSLMAL